MLIYFDDETKRRVLKHLQSRLSKDGLLMLGSTENPLNWDTSMSKFGASKFCYIQADEAKRASLQAGVKAIQPA